MSWTIASVAIGSFQGYRDIQVEVRSRPNFFIGINGSGKTTFIEILSAALQLDEAVLRHSSFASIDITFKDADSRRRPSLMLRKASNGSPMERAITGELKLAQGEKPIKFVFIDEFLYFNSFQRRVRHQQKLASPEDAVPVSNVKKVMFEQLNLCWLSIHRGSLHHDFDEDGDVEYLNPIDQKLRTLSIQMSRYFSLLDNTAAKETQEYQKKFFLSFLEAPNRPVTPLEDGVISEERDALFDIFTEFGLEPEEFEDTLDKHFERIRKTNEFVKKERPKDDYPQGIDLFSFLDTERLHRLVREWRALEETKTNIYKKKQQFREIVNSLFYQKELFYDDRNRVFFYHHVSEDAVITEDLSSGEKQVFILLAEAMLQEEKPTVYLADEPELSLHVEWQEKLVDSILTLNPNAQIVFATHSPDIVSNYEDGILHMESL